MARFLFLGDLTAPDLAFIFPLFSYFFFFGEHEEVHKSSVIVLLPIVRSSALCGKPDVGFQYISYLEAHIAFKSVLSRQGFFKNFLNLPQSILGRMEEKSSKSYV